MAHQQGNQGADPEEDREQHDGVARGGDGDGAFGHEVLGGRAGLLRGRFGPKAWSARAVSSHQRTIAFERTIPKRSVACQNGRAG